MHSTNAFASGVYLRLRQSSILSASIAISLFTASLQAATSLKQVNVGAPGGKVVDVRRADTAALSFSCNITALTSTPMAPFEAETVTLSATVKNSGAAAAPASSVNFYVGATLVATAPVAALASGASTSVSADIGPFVAGSYTVAARVNESNFVVEPNYSDNSLTQTIKVLPTPAPDRQVASVSIARDRLTTATAAGATMMAATSKTNHSLTITIPNDRGAVMPYVRYESEDGVIGGGAVPHSAPTFDNTQIAAEASNQAYVGLPASGAYVEWTLPPGSNGGAGVTMRFTMPDGTDDMGLNGSLDCYVNGTKVQTVNLSSYWSWQYFDISGVNTGKPQDAPITNPSITTFKFDEVHWKLATPLVAGDTIRIQSSGASGLEYGVDFLEIEPVPAAITPPANSVSVTDYGAVGDGATDNLAAFNAAVTAAVAGGKTLYIPAGNFNLSGIWSIGSVASPLNAIAITGAGIWYTNLLFTSSLASGGGVSFRMATAGTLDFGNMYLNSRLHSRYNERAYYKCFMDNFGTNSHIHDFWEEHFECGFWVGDYAHNPAVPADGLLIENGRIRNNLADGCNFCQGTKNSTVQNCSVRNDGDDGLAVWPDSTNNAPMGINNTFSHNTVENIWRAGSIAIFGGSGHKAQHNLIKDSFLASGIRLNTTFPGYHFEKNTGVLFSDTTIINCGTSQDVFNGECGAIEMQATTGPINNVTFTNIDVIDTQRDAIQVGESGGFTGVVFNNTHIDGTGLDATTTSHFAAAHGGAALFSYTNNGTITFNTLSYQNVENVPPLIYPNGFKVIIDGAERPVITTQPQSQIVVAGASVQFSVTASGVPAPTYQWYLNSAAIAGATGSSYSLTQAQASDAGSYSVVVSNTMGSVTSNSVTLSVSPAPTSSSSSSSSSGGGGGGGGAPSLWYGLALVLAGTIRRFARRRKSSSG